MQEAVIGKQGAMAAILGLDDAAVVKRFFKASSSIELHSENPEYEPIIIEKSYMNFKMVGNVVGIYRSMETMAV